MNKEEKESGPQIITVWPRLLRTTEGVILMLGIALAVTGLIVIVVEAYWSMQTSRIIGAMTFSNILLGRAVSMSIGYAGGYGHALVIPVNMWVETVLVLLFYPVFVLSMRKLVEFPKLGRFLERMHAVAESHHGKVRRYGIAGLLAFVWMPFWMTGPVVGSAIGYLLGFPAWLTLSVVLVGTYLAIVGWAYLLFDLYTRTTAFGPWAPVLIIGIVILIIIAAYALRLRVREQGNPEE